MVSSVDEARGVLALIRCSGLGMDSSHAHDGPQDRTNASISGSPRAANRVPRFDQLPETIGAVKGGLCHYILHTKRQEALVGKVRAVMGNCDMYGREPVQRLQTNHAFPSPGKIGRQKRMPLAQNNCR